MPQTDISALIGTLLTWLPTYGPGLLCLVAFCSALGLPLQTPVLVLATGALVRQGAAHPGWAALGCLVGSLLGETCFYAAGRWAAPWVAKRTGRLVAGAWRRAEGRFAAHPLSTIYLTRFLLTPLGIPTSLVAGSHRYPYWRFAFGALAGDAMWVLGYGLAGYCLGSGWPAFATLAGRYSGWVTAAALLGLAWSIFGQRKMSPGVHPRAHDAAPG